MFILLVVRQWKTKDISLVCCERSNNYFQEHFLSDRHRNKERLEKNKNSYFTSDKILIRTEIHGRFYLTLNSVVFITKNILNAPPFLSTTISSYFHQDPSAFVEFKLFSPQPQSQRPNIQTKHTTKSRIEVREVLSSKVAVRGAPQVISFVGFRWLYIFFLLISNERFVAQFFLAIKSYDFFPPHRSWKPFGFPSN